MPTEANKYAEEVETLQRGSQISHRKNAAIECRGGG